MKMRRYLGIILFLFVVQIANAQKIEPKFTFNVELGLPSSIRNKPFDDIMQGLICSSVYGQYSFPFHLNVGLGVRYSLLTINEFRVPSPVRGNMQSGSAFLKIGWDKFHNDRLATDFSVKIGYAQTYFSTDLNKTLGINPVEFDHILVEPTAALILSANERNSYRWCIAYCINGFGFQPKTLGLGSNEGYDNSEFSKLTQYLVVGFGYTYYFGVKTSGE